MSISVRVGDFLVYASWALANLVAPRQQSDKIDWCVSLCGISEHMYGLY